MSKETQSTEGCDPNVVAACMVRFENITDKLEEMHTDMRALSVKVSNGLSDRLNVAERHITLLQENRAHNEKVWMRYQTAFLSLCVALSTGIIYYAVRHFNTTHSTPPAVIQKP